MTRWTPGVRRVTPGFIGLGTLRGPRYTVGAHLSTTGYINYKHTHKWWIPIQWGAQPPKATDVATATGKQTLALHGTLCSQVKFAMLPFFSSPHLSFSGGVSSVQLSLWQRAGSQACRTDDDVCKYVWIFSRIMACCDIMMFVHARQRWNNTEPSFLTALLLICSSGNFLQCVNKSACSLLTSLAVNMPANSLSDSLYITFFTSLLNTIFTNFLQPCRYCYAVIPMATHNKATLSCAKCICVMVVC